MPIRPENRGRYPANWKEISARIKERAGFQCEVCGAKAGWAHPETRAMVVLTVAHMDHTPENCAEENLKALCQRCHNRYDMPERARGRKRRAREAAGQGELGI
jgi:5-methylcytosine-specific restriction endonuclease McrA